MTTQITLPARLDLSVASNLARDILALHGQDVTLDAKEVILLGTPGLQVLLAAQREWSDENTTLTLQNPPSKFIDQLARFGLTPDDLESRAETPKESAE